MSRRYKFFDQTQLFFISYATVGWVDLFVRNEYKDIVISSLDYCIESKGLEVYAWCIMTSHVHLIIGTNGEPMQDIIRAHKRYTSEALRTAIQKHPQESRKDWLMEMFLKAGKENPNNRGFQLWQQNKQPIGLVTAEMLYQRLDYLHQNPVTSGFVLRPEDWLYSSAGDYYLQQQGLLKGIRLLEPDTGVR